MTLKLYGIEACVFDAYGTLFDVNSAALAAQDSLGEKWQPLAELWRAKQLQYTWLRSLAGHHADFWQVTGEALDFALSTFQLEDPRLRDRLMNLYLALSAYPDVPDMLKRLKASGMKLAILSNGGAHNACCSSGQCGHF
jgi:2-haloacid dehalogenase